MSAPVKSPQVREKERLTQNPDESLRPAHHLRWYGYSSSIGPKDYGMFSKKIRGRRK